MRIMRKLLHERKKHNEKANRETHYTYRRQAETSELPYSPKPMDHTNFFDSQNEAIQKQTSGNLFTLTQADVIQDRGRNNPIMPISKSAKQELPQLPQKQVSSQLNLNALVVNRLPHLQLALPLNSHSTANLAKQLSKQKMNYLSRIENTKNKLERQMDSDAQTLRSKLQRRAKDEEKLMKIYVEDEYERQQKMARDREKMDKALANRIKVQQVMERQQVAEYKQHLQEMQLRKDQREERDKQLSHRQYQEVNKDIQDKMKKMEKAQLTERQYFSQARERLREIEDRFKQVEQFQNEKFASIQHSRNLHFEKIKIVKTNFEQLSEKNDIKKIASGLERYGKVDVKQERAIEERERLSSLLHYNLEGKLTDRKKNRVIVDRNRNQWSRSVLEMHTRQTDQVRQRNISITETVNIKKTYDTLKRDDQNLNYQDIIREYREDLNKVKIKHYNLSKSNERSRVALEKLQVKQRAQEMRKKIEMFENLWSQTLLPRNMLGDVQFETDLREPSGNLLSKAKELSIRILGKPMPPSKKEDEKGSDVGEEV